MNLRFFLLQTGAVVSKLTVALGTFSMIFSTFPRIVFASFNMILDFRFIIKEKFSWPLLFLVIPLVQSSTLTVLFLGQCMMKDVQW
jgi:hypothetical protein